MPFVMRGDSHITLPVFVPFDRPMLLEFDVRIDDTFRDHVFFGDLYGKYQYRYTRGRRHLFAWGETETFPMLPLLAVGEWEEVRIALVPSSDWRAETPLLFGAHSTNGGSSYLSPLRGSLRHIKLWVNNSELQHWWPIHEGQGLAVHDIIGGAHGTITKGLGAWRVETSPTAPPVERMSGGMMRSMV